MPITLVNKIRIASQATDEILDIIAQLDEFSQSDLQATIEATILKAINQFNQ